MSYEIDRHIHKGINIIYHIMLIHKGINILTPHATLWAWFNITKLLANLLTKPSAFLLLCQLYYNLVSIKCIIVLVLSRIMSYEINRHIHKGINIINHGKCQYEIKCNCL